MLGFSRGKLPYLQEVAKSRKASGGGSAGGAGYNYQARGYALISTKILGGISMSGWAESGCTLMPDAIHSETGSGGDDLRVTFESGAILDVQAKHGLQRGPLLWVALTKLAHYVVTGENRYGVLLIDNSSSQTVRVLLKRDIERIGSGRFDGLAPIGQEWLNRLKAERLEPAQTCQRLRIIVRDLGPGSAGEAEALSDFRQILDDPNDSPRAFAILEADGHNQIETRLARNRDSLYRLLSASVKLSRESSALEVAREALIKSQASTHSEFEVPPLRIKLPIGEAWMRLTALSKDGSTAFNSLSDSLNAYHEWYRLAERRMPGKGKPLDEVLGTNRNVVLLGGPGAGKSTLSRRVVFLASSSGELAIRLPLGILAARLSKGDTFSEALMAVALGSFGAETETLRAIVRSATMLVADGLDEADPLRSTVAEELNKWLSASESRRLVITTRPVGHNPSWFTGWPHFEIQPLEWQEIHAFVTRVIEKVRPSELHEDAVEKLLDALRESATASLAARNPQLLTFLVALFLANKPLTGARFDIIGRLLRLAIETPFQDPHREREFDLTIAWRVMEITAWESLGHPGLDEASLLLLVGNALATEMGEQPFRGANRAEQMLKVWSSRRILERISLGDLATYTFVHFALAEYGAASYLSNLPDEALEKEVQARSEFVRFRQTLVQLGATSRRDLIIDAILRKPDATNPVSVAPILACEVLVEGAGHSEAQRSLVGKSLADRISSPIPDVAYEAGEHLHPIAGSMASFLGPLMTGLMRHSQPWTQEVAAAIALRCGDEYVDVPALKALYPRVRDTGYVRGRSSTILDIELRSSLMRLLIDGARLLVDSGSDGLEVVKSVFQRGEHSMPVHEGIGQLLQDRLSQEDFDLLLPSWAVSRNVDMFGRWKAAFDRGLTELLTTISQVLADENGSSESTGAGFVSLGKLLDALSYWKSPVADVQTFRRNTSDGSVIEVIRGTIAAAGIEPAELRSDVARALQQLDSTELCRASKQEDPISSISEPEWSKGRELKLDVGSLISALDHPEWFVSKPACCLLRACFSPAEIGNRLKEKLRTAKGPAVRLCVAAGWDAWGSSAVSILLERLSSNLTSDCADLVKALPEVASGSERERCLGVIGQALASRDLSLVRAATSAAVATQAVDRFRSAWLRELDWWVSSGPQDPVRDGVVPPSAAPSLLEVALDAGWVTFDRLCELCRARGDVRAIADRTICMAASHDDQLGREIGERLVRSELPPGLLDYLSQNYGDLCLTLLDFIEQLLTDTEASYRIAAVRSLGDGWAPADIAKELLKSALNDIDPEVRSEALAATRAKTQESKPEPISEDR